MCDECLATVILGLFNPPRRNMNQQKKNLSFILFVVFITGRHGRFLWLYQAIVVSSHTPPVLPAIPSASTGMHRPSFLTTYLPRDSHPALPDATFNLSRLLYLLSSDHNRRPDSCLYPDSPYRAA